MAAVTVRQYQGRGAGQGPAGRLFRTVLRFRDAMHARDGRGRGILHFAASAGSAPVLRAVLRVATPRQVNLKDANGKTPLEYAYEGRHAELVKLLLEKGAVHTDKLPLSSVATSPPAAILRLLLVAPRR